MQAALKRIAQAQIAPQRRSSFRSPTLSRGLDSKGSRFFAAVLESKLCTQRPAAADFDCRRSSRRPSALSACRNLVASVRENGSRAGVLKLVLYSKPDCHLCHGLKEKIDAALLKAKYLPSELSDAEVEVRDITTDPMWEQQYAMSIPILTVVSPGSDREVKVRRVPPRSNADRVAKHIISAIQGDEDIAE